MIEVTNALKQKISQGAMRCFQSKGFDDVSVNDICVEADVARSSFYRAFSNKKDVIRYIFEHTDTNSIVSVEELLESKNDFDRIWIIGDRYISIAKRLGPTFFRTLMIMTLNGEIDIVELGHSVDSWLIRLTRNCQEIGIIRSKEPPEVLSPLFVDSVCQLLFVWCSHNGDYPIRARARQIAEAIADVAPEFRWTQEEADRADH